MFTLDVQPSNRECSSQTASTSVVFSLFYLAVYLLWDNFLISEMTSIYVNNTTKKTPCHPQSVHSLGKLTAENLTLPQLRDFRFERGVNEICALLGFCAASFGSLLPTFQDKSWWL